jgi:hypothetical protein
MSRMLKKIMPFVLGFIGGLLASRSSAVSGMIDKVLPKKSE